MVPCVDMDTEPSCTQTISSCFKGIKNQQDLRSWLMRAYFSPDKHGHLPYYTDKVTSGNVLEHISRKTKSFPQTPENIADLWRFLPDLRKTLSGLADPEPKITENAYSCGEVSLKKIAACSGGIVPMQVSNIIDGAIEKVTKLTQNLNSENEWLSKHTSDRIEKVMFDVAEAYADAVFSSKAPEEVFDKLRKAHVLSKKDHGLIDPIEKDAVSYLISWVSEDKSVVQSTIEDVFLEDIKKTHNVFLSYQAMVSRQIHKK